ncbi:hypothetical protein NA57DRAFT_53470 [Rhizodiscina lignyota]|uniref:Mediator complex subunit 15 KIX domain-containing protein n=1 Tax=Rhizodiscina lignyota TaxID=1504668 RepID=A0A9P4IGY2_9PEZI|nr:hypothetical protein NA57DRAFT_53470 [Rhizodiscina lignyota]
MNNMNMNMNPAAMQAMQGMQGMQNFGQNQGGSAITPANLRAFLQAGFQRQAPATSGWQTQLTPQERAGKVFELVSSMRLAGQHPNFSEAVKVSMNIEQQKYQNSTDKMSYFNEMQQVLTHFHRQRTAQNAMVQNNPMMNQGPGGMMQPGQMGQQTNPQMNQSIQPHLLSQMQASNTANNMQTSSSMNFENQGAPAAQMQQQRSQQNQQAQFANGQGMPQQRPQATKEDVQAINMMAENLRKNASAEVVERLRSEWELLPLDRKAQVGNNVNQFIGLKFRQQAQHAYLQRKMNAQRMAQQNSQAVQGGNQFGQRPTTPQPGNQMPQGNVNLSQLMEQQANARRSADNGGLVVPASNNNNPLNQQLGNLMGMQNGQMSQMGGNMQMPNGMGQRASPMVNMQQQRAMQLNLQAQAQAQQQAQNIAALRGQAGGLGGQMPHQSPANMSLLTQPVGQQGGPTPQLTPASLGQAAQTPGGMDPQALQVFQQAQRAAAAQGQGQNGIGMPRQLPRDLAGRLPAHIQQQLLNMSDDDFNQNLMRIRAGLARNAMMQGQMGQGQNLGQQNMQNLQMPQNMRPGGLGQGMQPQQSNQGNAMAAAQKMLQMQAAQRAQGMQQQQQQRPGITREMVLQLDQRPFPPSILNANKINGSIPESVKTWGQLKQYIAANPQVASLDESMLLRMQITQFSRFFQQPNGANQQQPMQRPGAAQNVQNQLGGPAPPAQMVPNGMGASQMPPQMVSTSISMQYTPLTNMNPQIQQQMQQRIMQQAGQQANMGQPQPPQPTPRPNSQFSQPPNQQMPPAQTPRPQPQAKPPQNTPQPPQTPAQQAHQKPPQGVKRPNDDVVEIPNPMQTSAAPTPTQTTPQLPPGLTPEQFMNLTKNMTPQQRQQFVTGRVPQAQQNRPAPGSQMQRGMPQGSQDAEIMRQLSNMSTMLEQNVPRDPPINVPPEGRRRMEEWLKQSWKHLILVPKILTMMMKTNRGQDQIRSVLQARTLILRQMKDSNSPVLADVVSMPPERFHQTVFQLVAFVTNTVKSLQKNNQNGGQQTQQAAPPQNVPQPRPNAQQKQPNQQQPQPDAAPKQQAPQHKRSISKPPAAPTDARPPTFPWGPNSPHGTPVYAQNAQPSIDLKMPDKKKQKTKATPSAAATPAMPTPGPSASPQVNKPANVKQPQQQTAVEPPKAPAAEPPKPVFRCPDLNCEHHARGFESQAELEAHKRDAHKPIADPLAFALEKSRMSLDLDENGMLRQDNKIAGKGTKVANGTAAQKAAHAKAQQKAPSPGRAGATPMVKVGSLQGKAGASPASSLLKTPQQGSASKTGTPVIGGHAANGANAKPEMDTTSKVGTDAQATPDAVVDPDMWKESDDLTFNLLAGLGAEDDLFGGAFGGYGASNDSGFDMDMLVSFMDDPSANGSNANDPSKFATPPLSSSPSSAVITPSSSNSGSSAGPANANKIAKQSPEVKSKDISSDANLELSLTIQDPELDEMMSSWANGGMLTFLDNNGNEINPGSEGKLDALPGLDMGAMPLGGDMAGMNDESLFNMDWDATVGPEAGLVGGNGIPGWS